MATNHAIEFLIWLLIAASVIAVVAARLKVPYTVALVAGGLAIGFLHTLPMLESVTRGQRPNWLTPGVVLVLFLPPLLFESSIKLRIRRLRENLVPILLLANIGVLAATLITGFAIHWVSGLPLLVALIFGSIISPTDPVSVISVFQEMGVDARLSLVLEGESLFNDGTAVVLFAILVGGVSSGRLNIANGIGQFVVEVLGAAALGAFLGYIFSKITQQIDEPRIEITLTTILAYSSYLIAESLHLSGIIATVAAGIVVGNFGAIVGMSPRTRVAVWSFWEYASFVISSILFLLIGMQVRIGALLGAWSATLLAVGAVLLGRALSIYGLTPISNLFTEKIPLRWQHVLVWGGLRGAVALALVFSLQPSFPYRLDLETWTFGVVSFSILIQGLTIKPLISSLGLGAKTESDYGRARAQQIGLSSARGELDRLLARHAVSAPLYATLRRELDANLDQAESEITELYKRGDARADSELHTVRARLMAAQRSAIRRAIADGMVSQGTGAKLIENLNVQLENLISDLGKDRENQK
ncbi:MAG: Na+/H+ antiporter [Terriglobia bacterium]